jgi:hypothetical protein
MVIDLPHQDAKEEGKDQGKGAGFP